MTPKVEITVWSDYVCPFCYLQEPVLDRIRDEYGEAVAVDWRAFELRPEPVPTLDPDGDYLHTVWNQSVYPMARQRGMTLKLPPVQPRSRRAFQLVEFERSALSPAFRAELTEEFRGEVDKLELLLGLDLSSWRYDRSVPSLADPAESRQGHR